MQDGETVELRYAVKSAFQRYGVRSTSDNTLQPYTVLLPESFDPGKPYPLIVFLHGDGADDQSAILVSDFRAAYVLIPEESPPLAITLPDNGRMKLPQAPDWGLRFDGTPVEGMEITFDASTLCL